MSRFSFHNPAFLTKLNVCARLAANASFSDARWGFKALYSGILPWPNARSCVMKIRHSRDLPHAKKPERECNKHTVLYHVNNLCVLNFVCKSWFLKTVVPLSLEKLGEYVVVREWTVEWDVGWRYMSFRNSRGKVSGSSSNFMSFCIPIKIYDGSSMS